MEDDGFTLVRRRGRARRTPAPRSKHDSKPTEANRDPILSKTNIQRLLYNDVDDDSPSPEETARRIKAIQANLDNLAEQHDTKIYLDRATKVVQDALKEFSPIKDIVCYGIGSLAHNRDSKLQFLFLRSLVSSLQIPGHVYIYDPVFKPVEIAVCDAYHIEWINDNEECKRLVHDTTLFYMPHCEKFMYHNLFQANWKQCRGLSKVVYIGNDTERYLDVLSRKESAEFPLFSKASHVYHKVPLPLFHKHDRAFHGSYLHIPVNHSHDEIAGEIETTETPGLMLSSAQA
ncbi:hypothetical protein IWQ62_002461 [Dispira parvispora]|uniref:SRR1-like domain-containing protein n=1 Tax=Dispira parvispora TaxID=1520584 RepID=A0A9W8AWP2_9FUNG|nr:hypothetical protein IWQ62_002461 [Dispira parvispora]